MPDEIETIDKNPKSWAAWKREAERLQAIIDDMALAAMASEHKRNPVLAYADSYRDMAKQGVESVPIWSVITDLERNIAPLYRHAQPAPAVPDGLIKAVEFYEQVKRENPPVETGAWKDAVDWVLTEACRAAMLSGGNDE